MPTSKIFKKNYCSYISSDLVENCRSSHPWGRFRIYEEVQAAAFSEWTLMWTRGLDGHESTGCILSCHSPSFSFFSICSLLPIRTQVFAQHPLISDVLWPSKMPRETASQKALQNPSNTHFYVVQKDPQAAAAPWASTSTEKTLLLLVAATSIERTAAHQTIKFLAYACWHIHHSWLVIGSQIIFIVRFGDKKNQCLILQLPI